MTREETLYMIALTQVPMLSLYNLHVLIDEMGSASAIFEHRHQLGDILSGASHETLAALAAMDAHLGRAEQELAFAEKGHVQCIGIHDDGYPERLRSCPDAPIVLYYCGNRPLNAPHVVSMVGTRQITDYGKELCRTFVHELKAICPDVLIVSGLAYGVDIHCHRAALSEGLDTVGVVAHGLEQIYPRLHRETAAQMARQGGLLTEYISGTVIDKRNFVQRNRIVAGISDATIIVESAARGGSLITGEIADGYGRPVFAFPGRIHDAYSAGCNKLIASQRAQLITSAQDFAAAMGWADEAAQHEQLKQGVQMELFADFTDEEQLILRTLSQVDDLAIGILANKTGLPMGCLSSLLFSLEMKGAIMMLAGGRYKIKR